MMLSFGSDNHSGVHPEILKALIECNSGHAPSYGTDAFSEELERLIPEVFGPEYVGSLVFNGTAANVFCLKTLLQSYESVICAETAHLHLDECGAPEYAVGVKVLTCPTKDGKIRPKDCEKFLIRGGDQHYSQPRMVSITQPTEYGTVYSVEELKEWRDFTRQRNLFLHIDGARLIHAAAYLNCELKDVMADADAVSFGGTKNGLMFGEIALFKKDHSKSAKYIRKQLMQLPSKSKFLAVQFLTLLKRPGLWREIANHGHELAVQLATALKEINGVQITQAVEANSVFAILPRQWHKPLKEVAFFYVWDEKTFEVRLMMSFDVTMADVQEFIDRCQKLGADLAKKS